MANTSKIPKQPAKRKRKLSSLDYEPLSSEPKKKKSKKTPSPRSITLLRKDADKFFSLYIRLRDSGKDGYGNCITCGVRKHYKEAHAGHFMSRRFPSTRWDELNVNLQCAGCNMFNKGEQYKYSIALEDKYGKGTAQELHRKSQEYFKVRREFLEQVISDAKEGIALRTKL